ncbi:velvet factor [Globomyces pollinis-pini]|nr:velvet factor [Globomyces pollinis-pini]
MCGVKPVVNRRVIDPPLVIQVIVDEPDFYCENEEWRFLCHLSLVLEDGSDANFFRHHDGHVLSNMLGDTVANAMALKDPLDHRVNLFSVFSNISIRIGGTYRLCCQMIDYKTGEIKRTYTTPFQIYNNQSFPGTDDASELTLSFISQGVRIRQKPTFSKKNSKKEP